MKRLYTSNFDHELYPEKFINFFKLMDRHCRPVDRFGILEPIGNTVVYKDCWPEFNNSTFREICFSRLKELLNKDKPLLLFASGGIDSLTIICLFVIAGFSNRLKVIQFENDEINYEIIKVLRNAGVDYNVCDENILFDLNDYYIIDGSCGDTLERPEYPNIFTSKVPDFEERFKCCLFDDDIKEWIDKCPVSLKNIEDFVWYFGYCLKYRSFSIFSIRNLVYVLTGQLIKFNNHESFYAVKSFSDYAYTHYDDIVYGYCFVYKKIFKDIIFEVFSDSRKRELINGIGKKNSIIGTYNSGNHLLRFEKMLTSGIKDNRYHAMVYYDGKQYSAKYVKIDAMPVLD